ncbi:MAG: protein kinase, partial [Gammaproteobacteria bacterium]|nr:protein kinase [Gammaproteobacteria bacterium]
MEDVETRKAREAKEVLEMQRLVRKREMDQFHIPFATQVGDKVIASFVTNKASPWQELFRLGMHSAGITDSGAQTLAAHLPQCSGLNFLDLHNNKIGNEGAKAIESVVVRCPALTCINLDGNPIDDSLKQRIETLLKHNKFLCDGFLAAAASGNLLQLQEFLGKGAGIRARDADWNTALHLSARGGHAKVAELLFENGLSFFSRNKEDRLPTELAELSGNIETNRCFDKIAAEIVNTVVFKQPPSVPVPSAPALTEPLPVLNEGQSFNSQPSAPVMSEQTQLNLKESAKPPYIDFEKIHLSDKPIASGGMGVIYSGILKQEGEVPQTVAVKMLVELQRNNEKLIAAIRKEYDILGTLCHPHVVSVIGYSANKSGSFCLIMEFYPRGSLGEYIFARDNWDSPFLWRLSCAAQVSQGLAFLHQRGLLHLDLTPENVLLSDNWRAVISDFGISRPLQEE